MTEENVAPEASEAEVKPEVAMEQHFADTREAAKAAVREAVAAAESADEGEDDRRSSGDPSPVDPDAVPERGADGKFLPKDGAKPKAKEPKPKEDAAPADDDATTAKVSKILRERERANEERQTIKAEREESARLKAEAAADRAEAAKDREMLRALKTDPVRAIREAGWDPEELVMSLARETTNEGALARQLRKQQEMIDAQQAKIKAWDEQIETQTKTQAQQAEKARTEATEKAFLDVALNAEKFPALARLKGRRERVLLEEAHEVAREYHRRTGEWASHDDLAEYLQSEWSSLMTPQESSQKLASASGKQASQPKAGTSSRSITTSQASERRSVNVDPDEMDDEERRQAAREAVRKAVRESNAA